jgi:hypothetical protein
MWPEADDEIIGGDLTAALAYLTPAGGAVVTPVAPIGLRDREAGTVTFTTSLGFGRKLERIRSNPHVALAYHAREHGFASAPGYVLVQGDATAEPEPDPAVLEEQVRPASERFMGPPKTGLFWDRWLDAYYADRVLVTVAVQRVASWPDAGLAGHPTVTGAPLAQSAPASQQPPAKGTGPRVDAQRAAARLRGLAHVLLGYADADGYPMVVPVKVGAASADGIALSGPLPAGGRRAGLLGHSFEAKLIGLEARQYTGWLQDGVYAPHTEGGFKVPANKTLLLLANGFLAKRGLKKARAAAATSAA